MTSFKRRTLSKQVALPPGTRTCPISTSTVLTSSGIPSLDDILGGGVPLSCSLVVLAPDSQSAYGELVQKYFVAQGIANGDNVCIVDEDAASFAKECMWTRSSESKPLADEDEVQSEEKIKIAWRYEQLKKFETTVTETSADHFCSAFDLTSRIPASVVDEACDAKRLTLLNLTRNGDPMDVCIGQVEHVVASAPPTEAVRISVMGLGSPEWGEYCPGDILRFLYALRRLLRRYPHACACVSLAPHICTDIWGGSGWVQRVGWVTDATIRMSSFGANPALTRRFPSHHGLVQIPKLPAPHSILPTSDKYSTLRGLSSSAAANVGTGENNLAFKCTRKRLVFETMHLGFEGGVGERRTTPLSTGTRFETGPAHTHVADKGLAHVAVELEEDMSGGKKEEKKKKKKVAFRTEMYDF